MKTIETKKIEMWLMRKQYKMNHFNCLEVGIVDGKNVEICDFISYDQSKDIFKCYEIKVSKQDFYSKCKKTFVGNYNYYAMPEELFKEVKKDIPDYVGVVSEYGFNLKKPKRVDLKIDKEKLLVSMLKSLNRENYKSFYEKLGVWRSEIE